MSENHESDVVSENDLQITELFNELQFKKAQLEKSYNRLKTENFCYKKQHNILQTKLSNVNKYLEKNIYSLQQLYDVSRSCLHKGKFSIPSSPIGHSLLLPKTQSLETVSKTVSSNALPTISQQQIKQIQQTQQHIKKITTHPALNIEPLLLQNLYNGDENAVNQTDGSLLDTRTNGDAGLSVIEEETTNQMTRVSVVLTRLPSHVMDRHISRLNEQSPTLQDSFANSAPDFSSTPLKLEMMRQLGLTPTPKKNFINFKRGTSGETIEVNGNSPENESVRRSPRKHPNSSKPVARKEMIQEEKISNSRPQRKAKPKELKEESLKTKKRRT